MRDDIKGIEPGAARARPVAGAEALEPGPGPGRPEPRWSGDGLCLFAAAAGGKDSGFSPEPIH